MSNQYKLPTGELIDLDKVESFSDVSTKSIVFIVHMDSGRDIKVYEDCRQHMVDQQRKSSIYGNKYFEALIVDLFMKACPGTTYVCPSQAAKKIEERLYEIR